METEIFNPRRNEREYIQTRMKAKKPVSTAYRYDQEDLSARRKGFWSLDKARDLLHDFIPTLSHESDGLIFQPAEARYAIGTCNDLLKWKFAHLNSVDFTLRISPSGEKQLALLETRWGRSAQQAETVILPGAKISIDEAVAAEMVDQVIECSWNREQEVWSYMRPRQDKETPNAYHVYEKVMKSILDNITEGTLLQAVDEAVQNPLYRGEVEENQTNGKTNEKE